MSDKKETTKKAPKESKTKKEPEPKREARARFEPTAENLKLVRACARVEYSLAAIKKSLNCTWGEAVALRHAALKADKS